MVTVERKREAVVFLKTKEVSERRSCQLILLARSTCQYRIRREPDEEFERAVKQLAFAHPRVRLSESSRASETKREGGQLQTGRQGLAEVRFAGATPEENEKAYSPAAAGDAASRAPE